MRGQHQKTPCGRRPASTTARRPHGWRGTCEQVLAAIGAADRNLLSEIGDDALSALYAARHLGERQGLRIGETDASTMSTKASVISSNSGPRPAPKTRWRRDRGSLHRRIEQHRARLRLPLRDPRGDPLVELGEIRFHRGPALKATDTRPYLAACRSICPLGSARISNVLPISSQPSSPGICVSELRRRVTSAWSQERPHSASTWRCLGWSR